jgi:hypothetical protein
MAQIESKPAFRLPWAAERNDSDQPVDEAPSGPSVEQPNNEEVETPRMIDTTTTPSVRRPTKFMAELSRAMQVAAETSRDETLARFEADAKIVVEEIHAASTVEAAALRRRADDDVAAVRDWSKAEIARIREEAEARVAVRKTALDGEMEAHGKVVEARVEQVTATVNDFETKMTAFFERLKAEEDPTRIATMAETMPDPPDLAGVAASIAEPPIVTFDPMASAPSVMPLAESANTAATDAYEIASPVSAATDAPSAATGTDFAAAEAEAAAFTGDPGEDDEPDSATADVKLAEAVGAPKETASGEHIATRVVVVGLVSVASIATFKRSLGRVSGISGISVASGPDGEFIFTVNHDAGMGLADAIVALPGFEARITAETAEGLEVAARDPDANA